MYGLSPSLAGFKMAAEQLIPIDIHYNKLLDWLIDRRHCDLRWASEARSVRESLQQAVAQLPSHPDELKEASQAGELGLNYFHVVKVTEVLKKTEEDGAKNIFGQYSSQRMKAWLDIQKTYEKQNIYLAECAQMLMKSVNYEIPALKRQIAKAQQLQQECDKKESDSELNAKASRERYHTKCNEMGIKGDHPKRELLHLVDELPQTLQGVAEETRALQSVVDFYHKFSQYVRGGSDPGPTVVLLSHVMAKGNTSVFEWRTGAAPSNVGCAVRQGYSNTTPVNEIAEQVATDDVIDFGEDIDFSDIITLEESGTMLVDGEEDGITVETTGEGSQTEVGDFGIKVETSDADVGSSGVEPSDLLTVLECTETRSIFLDDLSELQSFLTQRTEEYNHHDDQLHLDLFDENTPVEVRRETLEQLKEMKEKVEGVVVLLTSAKMTQLFLIRSSPTYVDRVVDSLQYHMRQANKAVTMATTYAAKRDEAVRLQSTTAPKLVQLVNETKVLQAQVAKEISKRYNNRVVNIIGEINLI